MILRICGLILPPAKREVFEEAWAADLAGTPERSSERLLLSLQFLAASLKIRAANDSSQLLNLLALAVVAIPVAYLYMQFALLRELIVGTVFVIIYRFRNLASVWLNRALLASAAQMFIASAFAWSRGFLVRDSAAFNSLWQTFGLMPAWVPIGLGFLTLVSAIFALSLWTLVLLRSKRLIVAEKLVFVSVLALGFPQLLWEVSYSIWLIGGSFLPDALVTDISQLQIAADGPMFALIVAGTVLWLGRRLVALFLARRRQYRSPRNTSTSESQTVDA